MRREREPCEARFRRSERRLTGGTQLVDRRGSCDAGVASLSFSQGRKPKVHCLIVPFKNHAPTLHARAICTSHTHCHPQVAPRQCMADGTTLPALVQVAFSTTPPPSGSAILRLPPRTVLSLPLWTELSKTSLFICSEIKYLSGMIYTYSRGGRGSSPLFGNTGSVQSLL